MKTENVLTNIIYCYKCYKGKTHSDSVFLIGECMHVICEQCYDKSNRCVVCHTKLNFKILDNDFTNKLLQNPSEAFIEPIESTMFQITSALNLIEKQKSEIAKLHKLLRRAKDEINRLKNNKTCEKTRKSKLFDFENQNPKDVIDKIYYKKSINEQNKQNYTTKQKIGVESGNKKITNKNRYLMDLTNKQKKLFTEYNPNDMSFSSSKSLRLTIPHKDTDYKYVYKKQNQR